jgi:hypothetical protein
MTADAYKQAWTALGSWIQEGVHSGHGVHIPKLRQIVFNKTSEQGKPVIKPAFQLSGSFAQMYKCRPGTSVPGRPVTTVREFNATQAALHQSDGLDRKQMADGLQHIVAELGCQAATGTKVRHGRTHLQHDACSVLDLTVWHNETA